jgi:hypothetical protein
MAIFKKAEQGGYADDGVLIDPKVLEVDAEKAVVVR